MKKLNLIFFAFVSLFFTACNKDSINTSKCKVTSIDRGNGAKSTMVYDTKDMVSKIIRDAPVGPNGEIMKVSTEFVFNKKGVMQNMKTMLPDGLYDVKWSIVNNRPSEGIYTEPNGKTGKTTLVYDSKGRTVKVTDDGGSTPEKAAQMTIQYNNEDIITEYKVSSFDGSVTFQKVEFQPAGVPVKSSESLLINKGIPADMLFFQPYQLNMGNIGTKIIFYGLNPSNGQLEKQISFIIKELTLNTEGYVTSYTVEDLDSLGLRFTETHNVTCN